MSILPVGYTETTMPFLNSYDGFIFDYGGVLVCHQTEAELAQMAAIAETPADQFAEIYWQDRSDYDKGLITGIEYWQSIGEAAGKILTLNQIDSLIEADSHSWMNFDEPIWAFIEQLRAADKRLAILSNMPEDLGETIKLKTRRFERFHHVTLSYEVKSIKPEPAIYEECMAGIGTPAAKTIFFDDKIANVQAAEMLGIAAVEFLDRDAVLKQARG